MAKSNDYTDINVDFIKQLKKTPIVITTTVKDVNFLLSQYTGFLRPGIVLFGMEDNKMLCIDMGLTKYYFPGIWYLPVDLFIYSKIQILNNDNEKIIIGIGFICIPEEKPVVFCWGNNINITSFEDDYHNMYVFNRYTLFPIKQ